MKFSPLVVFATSLLSLSPACVAFTLFGIDLGDFSYLESYFTKEKDSSVALSAGNGDDVCLPGDKICELGAKVPKSANEAGRPRYDA